MAITQYKVVKAPVQDAESVIGEWLAKGWQPLGAPVMVESNSSSIFQAMTIGTADGGGGSGPVTIVVADISDATDTGKAVMLAADQAAARAAIGAGTSSLAVGTTAATALAGNTALLAIGTTAATAKAGNYQPKVANISDAGAFGRQLLQAANQAAAKNLLGIA